MSLRTRLPLVLLAALVLPVFAACGSKDDEDDTPTTAATSATAGTSATSASSPASSPAASPTAEPFAGVTNPTEVEKPTPAFPVTLVAVRVGEQAGYDRIVFEFDAEVPSYRIEYVIPPIASCGSGLDTDIEGAAMLDVTLRSVQAHDEGGSVTVPATELAPGYDSIVEAEQTCDFEGVVEWGVGVTEELPYRVTELSGPPRLVVDVQHPE